MIGYEKDSGAGTERCCIYFGRYQHCCPAFFARFALLYLVGVFECIYLVAAVGAVLGKYFLEVGGLGLRFALGLEFTQLFYID